MTKLPEAELQKRVQQLRDPKTGGIRGLKALDAALATAGAAVGGANADAFTAAGSRSQTTHVIETPVDAFSRGVIAKGYAPGEDMGRVPSVKSFLEKASDLGVKRAQSASFSNLDGVAASYNQLVQGAAQKMKDIKSGPKPGEEGMSRELQFEMIKQQMQKISQIQDMLSNVLKMMNEQGMAAIRNSKA
jgi:hypothetical protein